jgi:hypothetical protein
MVYKIEHIVTGICSSIKKQRLEKRKQKRGTEKEDISIDTWYHDFIGDFHVFEIRYDVYSGDKPTEKQKYMRQDKYVLKRRKI